MNATWIAVASAALPAGIALGWFLNTRWGGRSLAASRRRAEEMVLEARREGQKARRAAVLKAREEIFHQRSQVEREFRARKEQLNQRERDLKKLRREIQSLEEQFERRREGLDQAETALSAREKEVEAAAMEAERMMREEISRLESLSGMTRDEARRQLMSGLLAETRYEAAGMIKEIKDEARERAEKDAVKIIALAVERAASDFSAERTVTQFALPEGSQLKGRIIGHEGKNIRAFEKATGIQILIDEDSNTVSLSGYNPVRREVARRVLEALVKDGNIHPRRIEDLTQRHRKRLEDEMRRAGEATLKELGIRKVHPDIVKRLGRLKYRTSYGQNVLLHSKEVAYLTGMMAAELRLDEKLARRAGLFHDIGKAIDYEREGTHPEIGAKMAAECGEPEVVINAIASHHEECEVISPISVLVSAADSLSGARPGARRKSVAEYIKRIERLEGLANSMEGVNHSYALQAGREIRVIAKAEQVDDARVDLLAEDLKKRIESEMDYPGKIKITVIREVRAIQEAH